MRKELTIFSSVFYCFIFCSCQQQVLVRLRNGSNENFKQVSAMVMGKKFNFENIQKGGHTQFVKVDSTYGYFPLELITEHQKFRFMPIDFQGEKIYKHGKI